MFILPFQVSLIPRLLTPNTCHVQTHDIPSLTFTTTSSTDLSDY